MTLTREQQQALVSFPDALRQLVHDELACGNSIVEIGDSFPAPPAGAFIKLANTVSSRPRASSPELSYRARNSAISSGEFTDERRFYFVIEPPSPPAPEVDMDAVRRENQSREDALVARALQVESANNETAAADAPAPVLEREALATHSQSAAEYTLHFLDMRPPHEIQFVLERAVGVLFIREMENDQLCMRANARVNGASYALTLHFVAARLHANGYFLRVTCTWAEHRAEHDDYFRRTSRSWFEFWTRNLGTTAAPNDVAPSAERYRALTDVAMRAEADLDSVTALQQAIVAGVQRGGTFVSSHKEGGTEIAWRHGGFVRTDYGDNPATEKYADEASFLQALRKFCSWDVVMHAPNENVSDVDAWRLIFRRMETNTQGATNASK